MGSEIAVAETEPSRSAKAPHLIHDGPAFPGNAPPGLWIGDVGERVHDRVEIRRNVQAEMLEIVAGVDQHGQALAQHMGQSGSQLGTAAAASERENTKPRHHSLRPRSKSASANTTNSESGLRGLSFPGRAGYPSVSSPCSCQSSGMPSASWTSDGQNSGAHIQHAPSPSAWAASSRFCVAIAVLCTAMRYSARARDSSGYESISASVIATTITTGAPVIRWNERMTSD